MEKQKRKPSVKVVEKTVFTPEIGKLPPQARELEEAVLGALMLEKDAYSIVSEILKPESFYDPTHQLIFGSIQGLAMQQKPVDVKYNDCFYCKRIMAWCKLDFCNLGWHTWDGTSY